MKEIIIIGAGSVGGHIAANTALYGIENRIKGFLDDDVKKHHTTVFGYPVFGASSWILDKHDYDIVIGIAFPTMKQHIIELISPNKNLNFPSLIAKNAWISNNCKIGKGVIIYPNCSINYETEIGDFVVMNMNCAVGHHVKIGDFTSLAPGVNLGGNTHIGKLVDIGIGSSTIQGIQINEGAIIGGQTMVIKNIEKDETVVGVPGKKLK